MLMYIAFVFCGVVKVDAGGTGTIRVIDYSNPSGKDENDLCCESLVSHSNCKVNDCDPFFNLCIGTVSTSGSCVYAKEKTSVYNDQGHITFGNAFARIPNPIYVTFANWQGGVQIRIIIKDHDDSIFDKSDDPIGTISVTVRGPPSPWPTPFMTKNVFQGGQARMTLEYGFVCDQYYYGDCSVYCKPDTQHFRCDVNGKKICLPGWKGSDCLTNASFCTTNPCQNLATCLSDASDIPRCYCISGFTGLHCDTRITTTFPKTTSDITTQMPPLNRTSAMMITSFPVQTSIITDYSSTTGSITSNTLPSATPESTLTTTRYMVTTDVVLTKTSAKPTSMSSTALSMTTEPTKTVSTILSTTPTSSEQISTKESSGSVTDITTDINKSQATIPLTNSSKTCDVNVTFTDLVNGTIHIFVAEDYSDKDKEPFVRSIIQRMDDSNGCKLSVLKIGISQTKNGEWTVAVANCSVDTKNQMLARITEEMCQKLKPGMSALKSMIHDEDNKGIAGIIGGVVAALVSISLMVVIAIIARRKWLQSKIHSERCVTNQTSMKNVAPKHKDMTDKDQAVEKTSDDSFNHENDITDTDSKPTDITTAPSHPISEILPNVSFV